MADEDLDVAISLRITKEDKAALDALAASSPLKALTIARIAMRIGLAALRNDPALFYMGPHLKAAEDVELEDDASKLAEEQRKGTRETGTRTSKARWTRAVYSGLNKKGGKR
jgi:hypothetical protein